MQREHPTRVCVCSLAASASWRLPSPRCSLLHRTLPQLSGAARGTAASTACWARMFTRACTAAPAPAPQPPLQVISHRASPPTGLLSCTPGCVRTIRMHSPAQQPPRPPGYTAWMTRALASCTRAACRACIGRRSRRARRRRCACGTRTAAARNRRGTGGRGRPKHGRRPPGAPLRHPCGAVRGGAVGVRSDHRWGGSRRRGACGRRRDGSAGGRGRGV